MRRIWAQVLLREDSWIFLFSKDFIVFIVKSYVYPDGSISAGIMHSIRWQGNKQTLSFLLLSILTAVFKADFREQGWSLDGALWKDTQLPGTSWLQHTHLPDHFLLVRAEWCSLPGRLNWRRPMVAGIAYLCFSHICISAPSVTVRQGHWNGLLWKAWSTLLSLGWVLTFMETKRKKKNNSFSCHNKALVSGSHLLYSFVWHWGMISCISDIIVQL